MWVFIVGFVSSVVFSLLFSMVPGLKLVAEAEQDRTFWAVINAAPELSPDEEASQETRPSESP